MDEPGRQSEVDRGPVGGRVCGEERLISSRHVFSGRILDLRVDVVELPNGQRSTREVVHHSAAVALVAWRDDGKIALVRQYRHPVSDFLWELPAGKVDPGEEPAVCAARELAEETGHKAGKLRLIGRFYTTPGFSDELMFLYEARELVPADTSPDEDEFVEVGWWTLGELRGAMEAGEIKDGKTLAGVLWALLEERARSR